MRRLAIILSILLLSAPAWAGTIPITGTIRQANGNLFNGKVRFILSYAVARDTSNDNLVVAQMVEFPVQNGALPASAKIVPNDVLQPANTFYTAQYINSLGTVVAQNVFSIQGGSFNIGTATPTPLTTSNISFGRFTGLDAVSTKAFTLNNEADATLNLILQAGDTTEQDAHIVWRDKDGNNQWTVGRNESNHWGIDSNEDGSNRVEINYDEALVLRAPNAPVSGSECGRIDFQTNNPGGTGNVQSFRFDVFRDHLIMGSNVAAGTGLHVQAAGTLEMTSGITSGTNCAPLIANTEQFRTGGYTALASTGYSYRAFQGSGNALLYNFLAGGDTQPAVRIAGNGNIDWGAGGSSAADTQLARTAASTLRLGTGDKLIPEDATGQALGDSTHKWNLVGGTVSAASSLSVGGGGAISLLDSATSTQDFGVINANTCSDTSNITFTGAADGDTVIVTAATAFMGTTCGGNPCLNVAGYVASSGNVKIRACNFTASNSSDPASASFRIDLIKH